jgi:Immunoglobulin-like domain of bacterial spore germination
MDTSNSSNSWRVVAVIVVALIAAVAAFVLLRDDGGTTSNGATTSFVDTTAPTETSTATTDTSTTQAPTTTAPPASTSTSVPSVEPTAPPLADATRDAIWPWADSDTRYDEPVQAATAFAVDVLGFTDPLMGEFLAGDARSGEVEVRSTETGPVTTVLVRQLTDDDSWWIIAAVCENITVDEPAARAEVTSPLVVSGTAAAFEGTVDVEFRVDGSAEAIASGFVTGSGGPVPGPFSETFEFASPGEVGGALILWSRSPENGSVVEAAAMRIFYR